MSNRIGAVPEVFTDYMADIGVRPQDSGAKGDGITDDTAAIQLCFTNAPSGGSVIFPPGTYKVSGSSSLTINKNLRVIFQPGASVDATSFTGSRLFYATGSIGTWYAQVAAIAAGDITFDVHASLAATLAAGDVIRITTNSAYGGDGSQWNSGGSVYYKGELCEVLTIVGNTVTLKNQTYDSYGANAAVISRVSPVTVHFEDPHIVGAKVASPVQVAIDFNYGLDCSVTGGRIMGFSWASVQPEYTLGLIVRGLVCGDNWVSGGGYNYGIVTWSAQDVSIIDCRMHTGRHAVSTGGIEPTRMVRVYGCDLDSDMRATAVWCIDSHDNTDFMFVENSTLRNGAAMRARNWSVKNCHITGRATHGVTMISGGTYGVAAGNAEIVGNTIDMPAVGPSGSTYGIFLNTQGTITNLTISGNTIKATHAAGAIALQGYAGQTLTVTNAIVDDNKGWASEGHSVYVQNITISNLFYRRNAIRQPSNNYHFLVGTTGIVTHLEILQNWFQTDVQNGGWITVPQTAAAREIIVSGNSYYNSNSYGALPAQLTATSFIEFTKNFVNGIHHTNGAHQLNAPEIMLADNTHLNETGTRYAYGRAFHKRLANGTNVEGIGAALPTTGDWKKGDRWVYSTGTVGQPKAAQCSTAGGSFTEVRQNSKAYTVGVWVQWPTGTNITVWECTTAGTTAGAAVTPGAYTVGSTVTDGTAVFTCRSTTTVAWTSEGNL